MTTIREVERALQFVEHALAIEWSQNDIIKSKIANGYDNWIKDFRDHKLFLTLPEYIETLVETPGYFDC
jgi:hypothetical protein